MKPLPLIHPELHRFLAAGLIFSLCSAMAAAYIEATIPNLRLYGVIVNGQLANATVCLGVVITLGLSVLWEAVYLCCRPFLYSLSVERARRTAAIAQAESERLELAQKLRERVWMGGPPSGDIGPRPNHRRAIGESFESWRERIAEAKQAHAERLQEVEDLILNAFARYSLKSDFFGAVPQRELFRTFGANLNKLGISDIGVLHRSTDPTIRQLVAYAPILRGQSGLYRLIKPYKKPFDPPPNPHLSGPFIKGYISGR